MLTTFDKAWVAGVVSFVCQYVLSSVFHIDIDPTVQAGLVSVISAVLVYIVPNKAA